MKTALFCSIILFSLFGCKQSEADKTFLNTPVSSSCKAAIRIEAEGLPVFWLDETPVTVGAYEVFAKAANYTTQAEEFGNSGVFDYDSQRWILVDSANFLQPFGKTAGDAPKNHPATHISFHDAKAFCDYYGKRLPSEAEWEAAARYKMSDGTSQYPWGDGIKDDAGKIRANVWQGIFPYDLKVEDGYAYTSPVKAYGAAPSGLYDMAGNVWEWTSDTIEGFALPGEEVHRIGKGGSFLCEPNWCHGYLINGSTHTSSETGLFHTGFRCLCEE